VYTQNTQDTQMDEQRVNDLDLYEEFDQLLSSEIDIDKIVAFGLEARDDFFKSGYNHIDTLLWNKNFKKLPVTDQLYILSIIDTLNCRYSDESFISALWYAPEVQEYIKKNFKRSYRESNGRYIQDIETY
jgi:hypothetical protein